MSARAALLVAGLLLVACASAPEPPAEMPRAGTTCERACAWRKARGCLEKALETACVPACVDTTAAGFYDPACVLAARTTAQFAACHVRCGAP